MRIDGRPMRTIWVGADGWSVEIIDQTKLPHLFEVAALRSMEDAARAISHMAVRGAPLIGATAAYGVALAMREDASDASLERAVAVLGATRPTAVNLHWALNDMKACLGAASPSDRLDLAYDRAAQICDEDVETCRLIGAHGLEIIRALAEKKDGAPVNILTHCNAGWIATVDWGTATSPMYHAHDAGIPLHVWVDETRPRNQGALTAWELGSHGISHSYITDNAGGHLMQHGLVDMVITGTDRTTRQGDVCNKIGTYLKALAAKDNNVPFYVALPSPTIDWTVLDGITEIPIEDRAAKEVSHIQGGSSSKGEISTVQVTPDGTPVSNPAFDVTPNHLVTGLITERGVCAASEAGLAALFPDMAQSFVAAKA